MAKKKAKWVNRNKPRALVPVPREFYGQLKLLADSRLTSVSKLLVGLALPELERAGLWPPAPPAG